MKIYIILGLFLTLTFITTSFAETMDGYQVSYDCIKNEQIKEQTIKVVFNNPTAAKLYADDHKAKVFQVGGNAWAVEYQVEEVVGYLFDGLQCTTPE